MSSIASFDHCSVVTSDNKIVGYYKNDIIITLIKLGSGWRILHQIYPTSRDVDVVQQHLACLQLAFDEMNLRINGATELDLLMLRMHPAERLSWCEAQACACVGAANCSGGLLDKGYSKADWQKWLDNNSI